MQHWFLPRMLLWTRLCSCFHRPICEWTLTLFHGEKSKIPKFQSPSHWFPVCGTWMSIQKQEKRLPINFVSLNRRHQISRRTRPRPKASSRSWHFLMRSLWISCSDLKWTSGQTTGARDKSDGSLKLSPQLWRYYYHNPLCRPTVIRCEKWGGLSFGAASVVPDANHVDGRTMLVSFTGQRSSLVPCS